MWVGIFPYWLDNTAVEDLALGISDTFWLSDLGQGIFHPSEPQFSQLQKVVTKSHLKLEERGNYFLAHRAWLAVNAQ